MQNYESTFQLDALYIQNPEEEDQLTPGDILNYAAYIMQSDKTLKFLRENEIGIERVTNVRNPKFVDDKDQFEASPSFDFVLTHKQILISEIPVVQLEEFRIVSV